MEGFKLNELSYDDEFLNALGELEHRIIEDSIKVIHTIQ